MSRTLSDNISFLPYPFALSQSVRHMCITPKVSFAVVFTGKIHESFLKSYIEP